MPCQLWAAAMDNAFVQAYCGLMEEVKIRHLTILRVLAHGHQDPLARPPESPLSIATPYHHDEVAWLNLRKICEIIGIGCLLAYSDVDGMRSMQKEYKPSIIMKKLLGINPGFFPIPILQQRGPKGEVLGFSIKTSGFANKDDIIRIWNLSGEHMHRGCLKSLVQFDKQATSQTEIIKHLNSIVELLENHRIPLFGSDRHLRVHLLSETREGYPVVARVSNGDARTTAE